MKLLPIALPAVALLAAGGDAFHTDYSAERALRIESEYEPGRRRFQFFDQSCHDLKRI